MIELHIDQNIIEYSRKLTKNKNFGKEESMMDHQDNNLLELFQRM